MEHFAAEEWVDLVRGVVSDEDRRRMENHLEAGCPNCVAVEREWRAIIEASQREQAYQPPPEQVRLARIAFALQGPAEPVPGLVQMARLLFDSFLEPAPVGIRGMGAAARQIVHQAGPLMVQVEVSPSSDPPVSQGRIVGQIMNTQEPERVPCGLSVFLLQRSRIQQVFANAFGEFQFSLDDNPALWLVVMVADADAIAVRLP